jgi:hypothetical protein
MQLQLGPEIMSSYKRLAYQAWYALAEFVDNSTQAYFNNRKKLDKVFEKEGRMLTVRIKSGKDSKGEYIRISDNSIGMSEDELKDAIYVGKPPLNTTGRSRYGLGLKTGACWFGDLWTITSKKLDDKTKHTVTVDVPKVSEGNLELDHTKETAPLDEHFTIIEIRKLHRRLPGRTLGRVRTYLRSLYRRDISSGVLRLFVNNEKLEWDANVDARLLVQQDGKKAKKILKFKVGTKLVTGWAGVLEKGSRKDAGFSIIQADRVIMGWPDSYRPETVFGVGGSNDLANQRLFGELVLEGFEVSHTKDRILFQDGQQEKLESKLKEQLAGLRQLALSHRKDEDERVKVATDDERQAALNVLEAEIKTEKMQTFIDTYEVPSASFIKKSNDAVKESVLKRLDATTKLKLGKMAVSLYLAKDMSPNDPYVIIESTKSKTAVIVIVNLSHPHWSQLTNEESILNFLRHCTYDGIAECKAYFIQGSIDPDSVKLIKDNLLRLPFDMTGDGDE